MISMALQRDVPQYMAMPWLITCVIARTISAGQKQGVRAAQGTQNHQTRSQTLLLLCSPTQVGLEKHWQCNHHHTDPAVG